VRTPFEDEVWERVREAERRYGEEAELILTRRIDELIATSDFDQASIWCAVAARLKDLHNIKLQAPIVADGEREQ